VFRTRSTTVLASGTASIMLATYKALPEQICGTKEDVRRPPYLCSICESKVGFAIVADLQDVGRKESKHG
jgi:hypothetical protein